MGGNPRSGDCASTVLPLLFASLFSEAVREHMANRAIWGMRKRHEWLTKPLKAKKMKRSGRVRIGLQDAMDRKSGAESEDATPTAEKS